MPNVVNLNTEGASSTLLAIASKKVLVIDDQRSARVIMEGVIRCIDPYIEVKAVSNPLEAIEWARRNHPDLILTDYKMREIDGIETIKRLRQLPTCTDVPIVMVTVSVDANSMFADLTSVAGSLYKFGSGRGLPGKTTQRRIAIHADEFNELIGDEFIPLLNKAGGAGFQVTAYTQTWSDVEARIGSRPKAGQIAGNFNSLIMLRVKEIATAELLTDQLPDVRIVSTIISSSVSDTNDPADFADFASRNEDRITSESAQMLAPSDLVQLPKGQAFALIQGGQLYKIRMPLPDGGHDAMMPENFAAIGAEIKGMHCNLASPIRASVTMDDNASGF